MARQQYYQGQADEESMREYMESQNYKDWVQQQAEEK